MTKIPDEVPDCERDFRHTHGWLAVMRRDRPLVSGADEFKSTLAAA
jgi:hypothetical protein